MAWTPERRARHSERMKRAYLDPARREACRQRAVQTGFQKGQSAWNKGRSTGPSPKRGSRLPADEIALRTATRRARYDGNYVSSTARGWKASEEKRAKLRAAMAKRDFRGAKNPFWRGGKSFEPYPPEFNKELKLQILNKQHRRCADCKTPIGCRGGSRPNVHHLDGNKWNCYRSNLVALCVPCHMSREWEVDRLSRLRTAWKKQPYVVPYAVMSSVGLERTVI